MSLHTNIILGEVRAELAHAQITCGYTAQRDDAQTEGQLGRAAVAYITLDPKQWPFDIQKFQPSREGIRRDDLLKAAGLIISEIARIDRAAGVAP